MLHGALPAERNLVRREIHAVEKPGFDGIAGSGEVLAELGSMQIKVIKEKGITGLEFGA